MKKLIVAMIGVTMLVSLTACGWSQPEAPKPVLDEEGIENIEIENIEIEDIEIEDIDVEPIHHVTWFTSGQHFGEPMPYCKVGVRH